MIERGLQTDDQNGPNTISNVDPISYIPLKRQFVTRGTDPKVVVKADTATSVEVDFEILAVTGKFMHGKSTHITPVEQKKFQNAVHEYVGQATAVGNTGGNTDVSAFIDKIAEKIAPIKPGKLDTAKFGAFGKKESTSELRTPVKQADRKRTTRPSPFGQSGTTTEPGSPSPAGGKEKEAAFKRKLRGDTITPKGK